MRDSMKAILLVPLVVFGVITVFFAFGYLVMLVLGMPFSLGLVLPIRLFGTLVLVSGFLFLGWLFKYRKPVDIIFSTYTTFLKVRRGDLLEKRLSRTEALVIEGPYRYVRHPLYFGVVVIVIGWWLILDISFLLVSAILLLLWFNFVVARFEEEELRALFGERYQEYAKEVPRIIPFTKRGKK